MKKERFLILLIALLCLFVLRPFVMGFEYSKILIDILFTVIFISGINAISEKKKQLHIALFFFVLSLIAKISSYLTVDASTPHLVCNACYFIFTLLFLTQINLIILTYVLRPGKVTRDKISAAICVYLLLGLIFGMAYGLIETAEPGAFLRNSDAAGGNGIYDLNYYSFVTLTTLGFGDITPGTEVARSFSVLEAVLGQLYLAVLVARLVGLHIAHADSHE